MSYWKEHPEALWYDQRRTTTPCKSPEFADHKLHRLAVVIKDYWGEGLPVYTLKGVCMGCGKTFKYSGCIAVSDYKQLLIDRKKSIEDAKRNEEARIRRANDPKNYTLQFDKDKVTIHYAGSVGLFGYSDVEIPTNIFLTLIKSTFGCDLSDKIIT